MGSIRHRKDRSRWQLDYIDADGIRRRPFCAAGTTRAQAEKQLREIEAGVRSGFAPSKNRISNLTLAKVTVQWLEAGARRWAPGTLEMRERFTDKHLVPILGSMRIGDIRTVHLQEWLNNLDMAKSTINQILGMTSSIWIWAIAQGLVDTNPVKGIARPKQEKPIPRYLARGEYEALLDVCSGDTRDAIILSVATGLRAGELIGLQWKDWQGGVLQVQRVWDRSSQNIRVPKNHRARRVPIHPDGLAVLEQREKASQWVMRSPPKSYWWWQKMCRTALERIEVKGGPHLLRSTFASWWVQVGGSLFALQRALGHASLDQVLVYAHLAPESAEHEAHRIWGLPGTSSVSHRPRSSQDSTSGHHQRTSQKHEVVT